MGYYTAETIETIKVKKLHHNAIIPTKATEGSAGWDLYALEDFTIYDHSTKLVKTGIALDIPMGWEAQVRSRSSHASLGVTVANSPGTIDSDYTGEICVIMHNASVMHKHFEAGDRIAQIVFKRVPQVVLEEVDEIVKKTQRGDGGFGSTGR